MQERLSHYIDPWQVAERWPGHEPLIVLGGSGRFAIIPTDLMEVDLVEFKQRSMQGRPQESVQGLPFRTGFVGLLSYDDFNPFAIQSLPSRIFRAEGALVFDQQERILWQTGKGLQMELKPSETQRKFPPSSLSLEAERGEADYLAMVRAAIDEILEGRFYQINLLRYFKLRSHLGDSEVLRRLQAVGGPFSVFVRAGDLRVASFSPERFVEVLPEGDGLRAVTCPIKGTAARSHEADQDRDKGRDLLHSTKDLAELHMIVDLMRNDLNRVSVRSSVVVNAAHRLRSFTHVHHLEAEIQSRLRPGLTMGEFFAALMPGGSITGAPKREVMNAIRAYERRERGYFMGTAFYWDDSGRFDSNILIRTLVSLDGGEHYEYAAGSGIVVGSDPTAELLEVRAKCGVLLGLKESPRGLGENP